jgi:hypothetical protein
MANGWKSGGRQAGTPNKVNSQLHDLVEAEAGVPLPVLLTRIGIQAMKSGDAQLAVNAFSRAAVFVYPRLAAVDPPTPPAEPIHVTIVGPRPCSSCGHDPDKDIHIHRHVIHAPIPIP